MRANGYDERPCCFVGHVVVASVITEQPWCRDDTRALQDRMDEREIRAAELVGQKPVDVEGVREHDAVGFAVVEAERRSRFGRVGSLIGIISRTDLMRAFNVIQKGGPPQSIGQADSEISIL